jgi:hypothetical protein
MRLTRLEKEREREREAWNSGRLLGVENEKRRDDHEGYHEPHHTFIVLFTSRAFHTNSQSELPLSLLPNSPFPLSIFLSILSLSLSLPSKFIYSSTYGYFYIFHLYSTMHIYVCIHPMLLYLVVYLLSKQNYSTHGN